MSWKKNIFSYILWIVYSAATCVGILGLNAFVCVTAGYPAEYGFGVAGAYLLLTGLLFLAGRMIFLKKGKAEIVSDRRQLKRVLEGLIPVLLLAAGLWLRIAQLMSISEASAGAAYLEAAYIKTGAGVPVVVHGATYLYLLLLHMLFFVFGNHVAVALILQIVLQLLGGFIWYFAVRRLAGVLSASVSFAFIMLSPFMVSTCAEVSPAFLVFLFYSIVLLGCAGCLKKFCNPVWVLLAGMAIGAITYLDVFGITVLLFFVSVLTLKRESAERFWQSKASVILFAVLGTAAGFFLSIGIDALVSGKYFGNVLWAWYKLYQPGFSMAVAEGSVLEGSVPDGSIWGLVDIVLLLGGMAAGCFGFWCRKKYTRQGVWIALAAALTALLFFQMEHANVGSEAYLYVVFTVLAGIGIETVFVKETADAAKETSDAEPAKGVETQMTAEHETTPAPRMQSETIHFLDNPLPVPKKHIPKTLDYRLQGEEDDQFDLEVTEEDDFDI